jgi:hypothetical protein
MPLSPESLASSPVANYRRIAPKRNSFLFAEQFVFLLLKIYFYWYKLAVAAATNKSASVEKVAASLREEETTCVEEMLRGWESHLRSW